MLSMIGIPPMTARGLLVFMLSFPLAGVLAFLEVVSATWALRHLRGPTRKSPNNVGDIPNQDDH
jgi:hypothetical protein